jgi:hypothetical protein
MIHGYFCANHAKKAGTPIVPPNTPSVRRMLGERLGERAESREQRAENREQRTED